MSPLSVDRDKVLAADAAYPFPLTHLPNDCTVVLRYVGRKGETPYLVPVDEVEAIRKAGKAWAPIWTPTNTVFSHQLGLQAGNEMAATLRGYPLLGPEPVFLDIEQHVYAADPRGCMAGVGAWQATMHAAGHVQAYAYLPAAAQTQWVADWVNVAPHHFAPGVIGVQYAGPQHGGEFDLSVFARSVFQPLFDAQKGNPVALTADDKKWLVAQLASVQSHLGDRMSAYQWDNSKAAKEPHANVHLSAKLDQVLALLQSGGAAGVDVTKLADALVTRLGPRLSGDLAANLAKRLAS
jgi:hypothetical protein